MKKILLFALAACVFVGCAGKSTQKDSGFSFVPSDFGFVKSVSPEAASKIAIIIPEKVIKSYSNIIINSSIAYALRQKAQVSVDVYLIGNEDESSVASVLKILNDKDYRFAIAGFTIKGANALAKLGAGDISFYIPTLHKSNTNIKADNIYFGGIDYDAQIQRLLAISNNQISSFYDNSALSNILHKKLLSKAQNARGFKIDSDKIDYARFLRPISAFENASVFLNTPLVKSAIVSSQLRANELAAYALLSTQIGYNPTIFSLTQPEDRQNLFIANSITTKDAKLSYINETLGQSVDYNWVVYATSVGFDYFYTTMMNSAAKSLFSEKIQDNQVIYDIQIVQALEFGFELSGK